MNRFAVPAFIGIILNALAGSLGAAGTVAADQKACVSPPYMDDLGVYKSGHHHPKVRVLVYRRNPDPTAPVHYPLQFLRPEPGLGIDRKKVESSDSTAEESTYRQIHVHDDGWGTLHVEKNASHPFRLCNLIDLWAASSEPFRKIWRDSAFGGAHVWIDDYHIPYIRLEELLRIPLDHDFTITICIEEGFPI